jgi:23S rRNA (uracil1939-C5)-methyltransferase
MSAEQCTIQILRMANGGDAVGKLPDGVTVFVRGALPDERVEIEVIERKKSFARAKLLKVIEPSPHRAESECRYSRTCGGCDFWHTTYANELDLKVTSALDTLRRIGKIEVPEPTVHGAKKITGWRTRANLTSDRRHRHLGFVAKASRSVVDVYRCAVLADELNDAIAALRKMTAVFDGRIFLETDGRRGVIVDAQNARPDWMTHPIHGIVGLGGEQNVLATESHHVAPEGFEVPAGRFRQGNTEMNHLLVERATHHLSGSKRVLELFCGMGNFTLAYAGKCEAVKALDVDVQAVATLEEMASALGLPVDAQACDLDTDFPDFMCDTVLLDPPRTGAAGVVSRLETNTVRKIVYVSCDPATLARDLATLTEKGFKLRHLEFIDMFPRTAHIETVAVLEA